MRKIIAPSFSRKASVYRYVYFLLSSLRLHSYSAWKQAGEPNPFVRSCYELRRTSRSELVCLFPSRLTSHV